MMTLYLKADRQTEREYGSLVFERRGDRWLLEGRATGTITTISPPAECRIAVINRVVKNKTPISPVLLYNIVIILIKLRCQSEEGLQHVTKWGVLSRRNKYDQNVSIVSILVLFLTKFDYVFSLGKF